LFNLKDCPECQGEKNIPNNKM